jgi:hypothetical protein
MLQFGASLTYETSSVNYDRNMFIIQATGDSFMNEDEVRILFRVFKNSKKDKGTF